MTSRSDDDDSYFSDPVKLVHTAEDRTFITDERFIDAEIIDLGDILSPEEDSEYDPPQETKTSAPTPLTASDSSRNRLPNPSVSLVDFCKRSSKNKCYTRHSNTKVLQNRPLKVKHHKKNSEDSKTDSDIEITDQIDSIESKIKQIKASKNNLTRLNHEMEIKKAIEQRNKVQKVDIKKNTGLIGMKIRRPTIDLDKSFGKISKENTTNQQNTNNIHSMKTVRKHSRNKHKEKRKTNLREKETLESKPMKFTTARIEKIQDLFFRKHPKQDIPDNLDKFNKEKQTDRDVRCKHPMSKFMSPKKTCREIETSLVKNGYENNTKKLEKAMSILTYSAENMKQDQLKLKQKSILEKYTPLKENGLKCGNRILTQNPKESDKNDEMGNIMSAKPSNAKTNNVVEQRSFPTLNKFTKNVLKKVSKVGKIPSSTNAVKSKKEEQYIQSNINLHMNSTLPIKEATQICKDIQSEMKEKSDTTFKNIDGLKNTKIDYVPKLLNSHQEKANLKLESPLEGVQNLVANNWNTQPHNYIPSSLAQSIEMDSKKAPVVKLPFPLIPNNTSSVYPKTNIQSEYNIFNNNNVKDTQHEKIVSVQRIERIVESKNQKQPFPETLQYSVPFSNTFQSKNQQFPILPIVGDRNDTENQSHGINFQYNKTPPQISQIQKQTLQIEKVDMTKPPPTYGNVAQKLNCMHQHVPDARMMKKIPAQPHNMNMYRPPPPNGFTPYQYYYPMTMPRFPDNSGMYTVNNQNHGCRGGSYVLPYDTEIFSHPPPLPPPPPPPPPPPIFPSASQQQFQQIFPNTNQLSTQNSIIGRNNDGLIKKINISAPPSTEPDVSNTRADSKEGIADIGQLNSKNVNEAVTITPAITKSEMLKELDSDIQTGTITVFTHSPKNNLKRPHTGQFPIREGNKNKKNKPCPLSKKVKVSDPRTLPSKGQINEEPVAKGYSPPILPIPTFENILSQPHTYDTGSIPNTTVEKIANKNSVFPSRHDHHIEVKKISLDEYKKKSSVLTDKIKENKYRRLDTLVKNLCQK